jgi:hypothetical protein
MSATAIATLQTIWDCKWSRPGWRVSGLPDALQPEPLWVCTRSGRREGVSETVCEGCPFWEFEESRGTVRPGKA